MKKVRNITIAIIIIIVGLFFSNPSLENHNNKIIKQYNIANPISGSLGAGTLVTKAVVYKNYYLFSLAKFGENGKTLSIGIANFVFITQQLGIENFKQWMLNGSSPSFKTIKDSFTDE